MWVAYADSWGASFGSQRAQIRLDPPRHLRNVTAGGRLSVRLAQTAPDTGFVPGGQGVAGSNPAVPTVFRTLVPRNGNEICHDRSHLTAAGRAKHPRRRLLRPDDRVAARAEIPARRAALVFLSTRRRGWGLNRYAMVERLDERRVSAGSRQRRCSFDTEYTDWVTRRGVSRWTSPG